MRTTRRGQAQDLEQLLELARRRRARYATYAPVFWRPADNAVDVQRPHFRGLLDNAEAGVFVALEDERVVGFLVASLVGSPPVYDPGGATCLVDDFTVAGDAQWPWAGPLLLAEAKRWAAERQAVQVVVVVGHLDGAKRDLLGGSGLLLTSEWWTAPIEKRLD